MSNTIKDGDFYIKNRKKQENEITNNSNGIEGFHIMSRHSQKKNPNNFYIPNDTDPGQMVMCETDKIRYIKINKSGNFLTIQEVEVYDEHGKNVALVKHKTSESPVATSSSNYQRTNPYMAIDGNISDNQPWPNSTCSTSPSGGWWELDLGKTVNVKRIIIYNRPDCCQERLDGTTVSLIDRNHNTVWSTKLNSRRKQEFKINIKKKNCGGPVIENHLDEFDELKELQTQYYRELNDYNELIKERIDNSRKYINASNTSNNKFANKWIREETSGAVGYVTEKGVFKWLPGGTVGNNIQGKNGCPDGWKDYINTTPDPNQKYSIHTAPVGEIVKMNGVELIKGTPMTNNQSCKYAGQNVYITQPDGSNSNNLNKMYHITDNLEAKYIPDNLAKKGVVNAVGDFQLLSGYHNSAGNISGKTGKYTNVEDVKKMCKQTDGCAAFETNGNNYWLKNSTTTPSGDINNTYLLTDSNLYIRMPDMFLQKSCGNDINPINQDEFNYKMGPNMTPTTTCGIGTVLAEQNKDIHRQYKKLNLILDKIHFKINELSAKDLELNNRLKNQYNILKKKLNRYEEVYKNIKKTSRFTYNDAALEEDATLNMMYNNKKYLLWSIFAMSLTIGALKYIK